MEDLDHNLGRKLWKGGICPVHPLACLCQIHERDFVVSDRSGLGCMRPSVQGLKEATIWHL